MLIENSTTFFATVWEQYFGQKSGNQVGNGAIVPQRFVIGAGCVQALPLGSRLRNSLAQLVIEGAPLETGQGTRGRRASVLVRGFEFG
jgi:hypothetical protein